MRLIERVTTTATFPASAAIDTAARGAHGAIIHVENPASTSEGVAINDGSLLAVNNLIATIWPRDLSTGKGDYVFVPLLGDYLLLPSPTAAGTCVYTTSLFDTPPDRCSGVFMHLHLNATLAALATFTDSDRRLGRFTTLNIAVAIDRAATINIDCSENTGNRLLALRSATIAAAGGGVATFDVTIPASQWRVRITNNDAALLATYTLFAHVSQP